MNKTIRRILAVLAVIFILGALALPAFAADEQQTAVMTAESREETQEDTSASATKSKAIAAAIAISVAAAAGAVAMAISIKSASEAIARQPEATSDIRTSTMLGLVFIETAIIYALIVVILIIFVL